MGELGLMRPHSQGIRERRVFGDQSFFVVVVYKIAVPFQNSLD